MQAESLSIKLVADIVDLQRKMQEAQNSVNGAMAGISKAASLAKTAFAAIGASAAVAGIGAFIKGAIDAADEMGKLSQKSGVAVEKIAGLQLAYQQAGLDAGAMQSSLSKLSLAATTNSDALKAMGIETRNTDGSMRSTREILGLVADRFASYKDGVEKTALAVQLFGKSGADMIPLLNAGGASLDDFDKLAKQLGLTMTKDTAAAAEKFNDTLDLIKLGGSGIARQMSAQLLPTISQLAEKFLTGMTSGNRMKNAVDALAITLRALYAVGIVVVEVFISVTKTLGSFGRMIYEIFSGNWNVATTIAKEWNDYIKTEWPKTLAEARDAFKSTGGEGVSAMTEIGKAGKKAAPIVGDLADKAKKTADEFASLRARIMGKESGVDADFDKNLLILKDAYEKKRIGLQEFQHLTDLYIKQQKNYQDMLKAEAEIIEQFERDGERLAEIRAKEVEDQQKLLKSVEDMVEAAEFEVEALKMSNVERETAIKLRELERTGIEKNSEVYAQAAERLEKAVVAKDAIEASIKQQETYARNWDRVVDQIGQAFTNSLMDGGKNAYEYIKNLFKTLVLRPLLEPIIRGSVTSMMAAMGVSVPGSASASTSGGGFNLGSLQALSSMNSIFETLSKGFQAFGSTVGTIVGTIGNLAGSGTVSAIGTGMTLTQAQAQAASAAYSSAGMSNIGSSLTTGSQLGAAANLLGGALVGFIGGKMISGGYSAIGKSGNAAVAAGTAIGAIWGPIGAAIGGAIGGLVNRVFGHKLTQVGIAGEFGGNAGFDGRNYKFEKGGWFSDDKTSYSPLDSKIKSGMAAGFLAMRQQIVSMGITLGQSADAVMAYTNKVKLNFKGLSSEQIDTKLAKVNAEMSDAMAMMILGGEQLIRTGETASQALNRLYSSITTVNGVLDALNMSMYQSTLAGAELASKLADAFGSLENFNIATGFYYENFFSESERAANTTQQVTAALANLGYALPATREAFRAIISALDLTTESGRGTFAALVTLAPAFASITKTAEQIQQEAIQRQEEALSAARAATDAAYNALQKIVGAELRAAEASVQAAQNRINAIETVFNTLDAAITNLTGTARGMTVAEASAFLTAAIDGATRGQLPNQDDLSASISAMSDSIQADRYATAFEMERDRMLLAGRLAQLRDLTEDQMSVAERQLQRAEQQVAYLNGILNLAQAQIEAMRTINGSAVSIQQAIINLQAAMTRESGSGSGSGSGGGTTNPGSDIPGAFPGVYKLVNQTLYFPDGGSHVMSESTKNGRQMLIDMYGLVPIGGDDYIRTKATGGYVPGGLTLVGERGPELVDFQRPGMVYDAGKTAMMMGGDNVAHELRVLREENAAQARALVALQARTTRLLERWDGDGMPEVRAVA